MPFIRLKVKNGVKEDFNVAHVIRFSPNEDKTTTVTLTDESEVTVEEGTQAVRGAIRRAEAGGKEQEAPEA